MLVKALVEWLASLWYEMVENILSVLLGVFTTDLTYFTEHAPVVSEMQSIFLAAGWALLIGNLVFQSIRSMASGIGVEGEEPQLLFTRTFLFGFLLIASPQICRLGMQVTSTVTEMLKVPTAVAFTPFDEGYFETMPNAGWFVVIIINIVIQWQFIKLFFEVAERYVVLCVLTYLAPLAFAMGGAKSTGEIFRGFIRMFASMCALMAFNVFFVKLVLSALGNAPSGLEIVPWAMFIIGIVRVAKKMDGLILRIGLNPAMTGDPLGSRLPGMMAMVTARTVANGVLHTIAGNKMPPGTERGDPESAGRKQRAGAAAYANAKSGHASRADFETGSKTRTKTAGADSRLPTGSAPQGASPVAGAASVAGAAAHAAATVQPATGTPHTAAPPSSAKMPRSANEMPNGTSGARAPHTAATCPGVIRGRAHADMGEDARTRRMRKAIMIEAEPDFEDDLDRYGTGGPLMKQANRSPQQTAGTAENVKSARGSVMPTVPPIPPRDLSFANQQEQSASAPHPQSGMKESNDPTKAGAAVPASTESKRVDSENVLNTRTEEKAGRPGSVPIPPVPYHDMPIPTATSGMDGLLEKNNAPQAVPQGGSHVHNNSVQAGSFSAETLVEKEGVGAISGKASEAATPAAGKTRSAVSPRPVANGGGATRAFTTPAVSHKPDAASPTATMETGGGATHIAASPVAASPPLISSGRPAPAPMNGAGATRIAASPVISREKGVSYERPATLSTSSTTPVNTSGRVEGTKRAMPAQTLEAADQSTHHRHMSGAEDLHKTPGRAAHATPLPQGERRDSPARTVNPLKKTADRTMQPPISGLKRGEQDGRRKK